jgi:hypothetical protein
MENEKELEKKFHQLLLSNFVKDFLILNQLLAEKGLEKLYVFVNSLPRLVSRPLTFSNPSKFPFP